MFAFAALTPRLLAFCLAVPSQILSVAPATHERSAPPAVSEAAGASSETSRSTSDPGIEDKVDALISQADVRFNQADYDGAVELYKQAYELDPDPAFLYNIGRIYEESGQLEDAVAYYRNFIRQPGVNLELRERTMTRLRVLRGVLEETDDAPVVVAPAPAPTRDPAAAATPVSAQPSADKLQRSPTARKLEIAGFTLLGIAAPVLIAGAITGGLAQRDANDLSDEDDPLRRQDLLDEGTAKARAADGLFIAGGVIAVAGLVTVLIGVTRSRRPSTRARVQASAGPHGFGLRF